MIKQALGAAAQAVRDRHGSDFIAEPMAPEESSGWEWCVRTPSRDGQYTMVAEEITEAVARLLVESLAVPAMPATCGTFRPTDHAGRRVTLLERSTVIGKVRMVDVDRGKIKVAFRKWGLVSCPAGRDLARKAGAFGPVERVEIEADRCEHTTFEVRGE